MHWFIYKLLQLTQFRRHRRNWYFSHFLFFVSVIPFVPLHAVEIEMAFAHPDWAPSGESIAFEASINGERNVYVMSLDSTFIQQLTFNKEMDTYPRYSNDGNSIIFLSRRHPLFSIHLIQVDGTDERQLFSADGNLEPTFSPDDKFIAFRSYLGGEDADGEIMIANVDGGNPIQLTNNDTEDGYPSFSHDGKKLFFHRVINKYRQIMMIDLKTGTEHQLTKGTYNSWHAHASPNGEAIVFDGDRFGNRDIFKMNLVTENVTQLTKNSDRDGYPKFSPDGNKIAFHSNRRGKMEIFIMDSEGSNQEPLEMEHLFDQVQP